MFTFLTVGSFRAKGTRTNWQEGQRFAGNCACQTWLISEPFIPACITLKMLLEGQDTTVLSWPAKSHRPSHSAFQATPCQDGAL